MAELTNLKLLADFFNKIGPSPTSRVVRRLVGFRGKADVEFRKCFRLILPRRAVIGALDVRRFMSPKCCDSVAIGWA